MDSFIILVALKPPAPAAPAAAVPPATPALLLLHGAQKTDPRKTIVVWVCAGKQRFEVCAWPHEPVR
jgi:hypothetical protein